jgi:hypothetical protein
MLRYGHGMATEDRQSFTKAGNARLLWWVEVLCVSCQFQPSRNRRLRTALCAGAVGGTMIDPIRGPKGTRGKLRLQHTCQTLGDR